MQPSTPPQLPPPGWYTDLGRQRWWDGRAWGEFAGPVATLPDEERGRTTAVLSHLGFIAGGFILPLVLWLIEKDKPNRNRFVVHHALEALNFQITFMIGWMVVGFGGMAAIFASADFSNPDAGPPIAFFAFFPLFFGAMALQWGCAILAMVRANQGSWWRYPVSVRLVGRGEDLRPESARG